LELKEIKELLQIISEKDITEFELEEEGVKLRVKKGGLPVVSVESNNHHPTPLPAGAESLSGRASAERQGGATQPGVIVVRSPMVGTFYRCPEPGAPPFASVGDHVKTGQVLGIVEAMKLMNEIESEHSGEIVAVHVENGQPVQYGDPLFDIRPLM
jgi:oxaloacetate decarboxylase alpha subunit